MMRAWRRALSTALNPELVRTACVLGPAPQVSRTVQSLYRNGLAPTALSVTPSTTQTALGSALKARLDAQDMADMLRAKLSLYPSAKGLAPLICIAPESVHVSEEFKYVFVSGPTFWRKELASLSLRGGKHVVVAPPRTAEEAAEIGALANSEQALAVLYDELRFAPQVGKLRDLILAGNSLGPADSLRVQLSLAPPLCCTDGHPTAEERRTRASWWHSRSRGGGALGAAGVQGFELLQHLMGASVGSVRATLAATEDERDGAAEERESAMDYAPEYCVAHARLTNGAFADLVLDWRGDGGAAPATALRVEGRDGHASLDLGNGRLVVQHRKFGGSLGDEQVLLSGDGDLADDAHGALAHVLMDRQANGTFGSEDWDSVRRSFQAVTACYQSWDASRGAAWEEVGP